MMLTAVAVVASFAVGATAGGLLVLRWALRTIERQRELCACGDPRSAHRMPDACEGAVVAEPEHGQCNACGCPGFVRAEEHHAR